MGGEKGTTTPPPIRPHTKRMKYTTHLKIEGHAAADMCEFVVSKSRDFGSTFDFPNTKRGDASKRDF